MKTGFKSQCVPDYRLLTEEQIGEIHRATLDLLFNTGVKVLNEEARTLLTSAGCRMDAEHIVKIPGWLGGGKYSLRPFKRDGLQPQGRSCNGAGGYQCLLWHGHRPAQHLGSWYG